MKEKTSFRTTTNRLRVKAQARKRLGVQEDGGHGLVEMRRNRNSQRSALQCALLFACAAVFAASVSASAGQPHQTAKSSALTFEHVEGCFDRAAAWAGVHPELLRAIRSVESQGNPAAVNWNRNGTYDVGLMQVNSSWYAHGLRSWWQGLGHPCVNVAAAAWILRQCVDDHGYTWNAVGCYHAGSGWRKREKGRLAARRYIGLVHRAIDTGH